MVHFLFTLCIIQGLFTTIGYIAPQYVNLAGLLYILKSHIKTSGLTGWTFNGCFEEDCDPYINEKEYIDSLSHHTHMMTGYCWR